MPKKPEKVQPRKPRPKKSKAENAARKRQRERKALGLPTPKCSETSRRTGNRCGSYAVEGGTKCIRHGGKVTVGGGEVHPKTVTGTKSPAFQVLAREGSVRLAELEADPNLLSVKRPAALSTFLVEQLVIEPSVEQIEHKARDLAGDDEVTDAIRVLARNDIIEQVHRIVSRHATVVFAANKAQRVGELIVAEAMPVLAKFAEGVLRLAEHYLDETEMVKFKNELRQHVMVAIAQLGRVGQDSD